MAATMVPSNFVTPNASFEKNPNWTPNEQSVPQSNVLVEPGNSRIMVVCGKNPKVLADDIPVTGLGYTTAFGEGVYTEEAAVFSMRNVSIQQCSGLQLESVHLWLPGSGSHPASRSLARSLCTDYVDPDLVTPRRFVLNSVDMNVPLIVDGKMYNFNLTSALPQGQNIAYYPLVDVLNYLVTGLNNFMRNSMGDTNFYATIYNDGISLRLFWTSPLYGQNKIRLILSEFENRQANIFNILLNHIAVTDLRTGDTSQTGFGYAAGESLGIQSKRSTGFQNNSSMLSIHSSELTQFRKSDSIAPIEGTSLVGCCFPMQPLADENAFHYAANIQTGGLVSPKLTFDRTQTLTEFTVSLRVLQGTGNAVVSLKATELQSAVCILSFRLW